MDTVHIADQPIPVSKTGKEIKILLNRVIRSTERDIRPTGLVLLKVRDILVVVRLVRKMGATNMDARLDIISEKDRLRNCTFFRQTKGFA